MTFSTAFHVVLFFAYLCVGAYSVWTFFFNVSEPRDNRRLVGNVFLAGTLAIFSHSLVGALFLCSPIIIEYLFAEYAKQPEEPSPPSRDYAPTPPPVALVAAEPVPPKYTPPPDTSSVDERIEELLRKNKP